LLALCLATLPLPGCETEDLFMAFFTGAVPVTPANGQQVFGTLFQHVIEVAVPQGVLQLDGTVVPLPQQEPRQGSVAAETLPSTLRLILQRKNPQGQVVQTITFDVAVGGGGTIAPQSFPLPAIVIDNGGQLAVLVQPVDTDLPASTLSLRVRYRRT
jgi:hypothetical protein